MTQPERFSSCSPFLHHTSQRSRLDGVVSPWDFSSLQLSERLLVVRRSTFAFHWASGSHLVVTYEYSLDYLFPVCPQVLIPELHFVTCRAGPLINADIQGM